VKPARSPQPRERLATLETVAGAPLHVVLVEPEIPPNTGNVARLCAASGCALHLVEPLGFSIDDRELKRAGLDYWHALPVVLHASLETFLASTSAMRRWFFSTRGTHPYTHAPFEHGDMLVFGKETAGLPGALLERYPDQTLRIPIRSGSVRSINLSTAVGIAAYGALTKIGFPGMR
jgi:tRNA (cytidine/uridine-2'-O-)-methyltransferase